MTPQFPPHQPTGVCPDSVQICPEVNCDICRKSAQSRKSGINELLAAIENRFDDTNRGRGVVGVIRNLANSLQKQEKQEKQHPLLGKCPFCKNDMTWNTYSETWYCRDHGRFDYDASERQINVVKEYIITEAQAKEYAFLYASNNCADTTPLSKVYERANEYFKTLKRLE